MQASPCYTSPHKPPPAPQLTRFVSGNQGHTFNLAVLLVSSEMWSGFYGLQNQPIFFFSGPVGSELGTTQSHQQKYRERIVPIGFRVVCLDSKYVMYEGRIGDCWW